MKVRGPSNRFIFTGVALIVATSTSWVGASAQTLPDSLIQKAGCPELPTDEENPKAFSSPPLPRDRAATLAAIEAAYPEPLRQDGVGGTVRVLMFVDTAGTVMSASIASSSNHPRLDSAAVSAAHTFEFFPAYLDRSPICKWIQLPVIFSPPGLEEFDGPLRFSSIPWET